MHACISAREDQESSFTAVEVVCCWCIPVSERERPDNAILTYKVL